jgi:hypothetical protein
MIPFASDQDCDKFYRATVCNPAVKRKEVSQRAFAARFAAGSILYAHENGEPDSREAELLAFVLQEWQKTKAKLIAIRKHFETVGREQPDHIKLHMLVGDAVRYEVMLEHALSLKNATEAFSNYFHLVFSLDLLFSVNPPVDCAGAELSLASLECCVKEYWVDSVFENPEG